MSSSREGEALVHVKRQCQEIQQCHRGGGQNQVEKLFFKALTVTQSTPKCKRNFFKKHSRWGFMGEHDCIF